MHKPVFYWMYNANGRYYQCCFGENYVHKIQLSNVLAHYDNLKSDNWTVRLFFKGDYSPRIKDNIIAQTPEEAQKKAIETVKKYIYNNLMYWQNMSDTINYYKSISVAPQMEE